MAESTVLTAYVFTPTDDLWGGLEKQIGFEVSKKLRLAITEIIEDYFVRAQHELVATNASILEDAVACLNRASGNLLAVLCSRGIAPNVETEDRLNAGHVVERLINNDLESKPPFVQRYGQLELDYGQFVELLTTFSSACDTAMKSVAAEYDDPSSSGGFKDGESWRLMVGKLKGLAKSQKWSAGGSSSRVTKFAAFLYELQSRFPRELQRYMHSKQGLSGQIKGVKINPPKRPKAESP